MHSVIVNSFCLWKSSNISFYFTIIDIKYVVNGVDLTAEWQDPSFCCCLFIEWKLVLIYRQTEKNIQYLLNRASQTALCRWIELWSSEAYEIFPNILRVARSLSNSDNSTTSYLFQVLPFTKRTLIQPLHSEKCSPVCFKAWIVKHEHNIDTRYLGDRIFANSGKMLHGDYRNWGMATGEKIQVKRGWLIE